MGSLRSESRNEIRSRKPKKRVTSGLFLPGGFLCGSAGEESVWSVGDLGWEDWRRERLPTSVFLPGEFHGLCSLWGHRESETRLSDFHFNFHFFPGYLKSYHRAWRRDVRKLDCPRLPALGCGERCGPSRAIVLSRPVHLGRKEDKEFLETLGNVRLLH